jgi:hypothetical protein
MKNFLIVLFVFVSLNVQGQLPEPPNSPQGRTTTKYHYLKNTIGDISLLILYCDDENNVDTIFVSKNNEWIGYKVYKYDDKQVTENYYTWTYHISNGKQQGEITFDTDNKVTITTYKTNGSGFSKSVGDQRRTIIDLQ